MKSGYQTALKVISIITIVFASLTILFAIFMLAGSSLLGIAVSDPSAQVELSGDSGIAGMTTLQAGALVTGVGVLVGVLVLIEGGIDLIVGILGVRGANDPRKIGPFLVFAIIGLILAILSLLSLLFQHADASMWVSGICSLILPAICVWLAVKIKSQAMY